MNCIRYHSKLQTFDIHITLKFLIPFLGSTDIKWVEVDEFQKLFKLQFFKNDEYLTVNASESSVTAGKVLWQPYLLLSGVFQGFKHFRMLKDSYEGTFNLSRWQMRVLRNPQAFWFFFYAISKKNVHIL